MNTSFYKFWLPFSIVVHVVLLAIMNFIIELPLPTPGAVSSVVEVNWIPVAYAETPPPTPALLPVPPPVAPVAVPPIVDQPVVATPPPPQHVERTEKTGLPTAKTHQGSGVQIAKSDIPGSGHGPTKAVKLMTSPAGTTPVPEGDPKGLGTHPYGDLDTPAGASQAAAAKGGPVPDYPKVALDDNVGGTVFLTVTVSATGMVEHVTVSRSSGNSALDRAAIRAAQAWTFTAALANGAAVSDTVQLQFTYANGKVDGKQI